MVAKRQYNFDAEMVLAEEGTALTASDIPQSGGVDIILDVGAGRFEAVAIFDVTAIEIDSNNELFRLCIQGSNSATFASSNQDLAILELGATEVRVFGSIDSTVGRYELPFINEQDDVTYRYLRLNAIISGTQVTGITFGAWVAPFKS